MELEGKLSRCVYYSMAVVGGFLAAYAVLNRGGMLGNSQTVNLLNLLFAFLGRTPIAFIIHLGAVLIYICGVCLTVIVMKKSKLSVIAFSIIVDFITVFILGLLPQNMNNVLALYPILFATAVQWTTFNSVDGYVSSSVLITNNLKQATISLTEYFIERDKSHLHRVKFYVSVLVSFNLGAVISFFSHETFGLKSAWICFIPLLLAFCFFILQSKAKVSEEVASSI